MLVVVIERTYLSDDSEPIVVSSQPMEERLAPAYIEHHLERLRSNPNPLDVGSTVEFCIVKLERLTAFRSIAV